MIKGSKHTVITKLKISETKTGRYCTPEHKHKLSLAKQGHYVSEETKKKIGLANKGKKLKSPSEETRKKLSEVKKGKPAWNKGIPHTEEHRKKISESNKGKKGRKQSEEHRRKNSEVHKGKSAWNKGIFCREETKQKIGQGNKGKVRTEEQRKRYSEAKIKYLQENGVPQEDTKPEIEAENILKKYNLNYKKQFPLKYNNRYRYYDFYLPDYNILLEIDGTYWHSKNIKDEDIVNVLLKGNRINDKLKDKLAQEQGYNLIRIWSDEMFKLEDYCSKELLKTVSI